MPLSSFRNERAFATIFRIERIFSGFEMLVVNEPPLIIWDDEDVDLWVGNMELNWEDAAVFKAEFNAYRNHFRQLARTDKKRYRAVLNRATFVKWLKRKSKTTRQQQLDLMEEFLKLPSFELVF